MAIKRLSSDERGDGILVNLGNVFVGLNTITSNGNAKVTVSNSIAFEARHAGNPYYQFYNTAGGTDQKYWRIGGSTSYIIETVNDAYTSATQRMIIFNAGNVGIGTINPTADATLSVSPYTSGGADVYIDRPVNTADGSLNLRGGPTTATSGMFVARGSGGTYNVGGVEILTNGVERMRITAAGNVGIGYASPTEFQVYRSNAGGNMLAQFENSSTVAGSSSLLQVKSNIASGYSALSLIGEGNKYIFFARLGIEDARISAEVGGNLVFYNTSATTQRMILTSAGYVGINESNPNSYLYVKSALSNVNAGRFVHTGAGTFDICLGLDNNNASCAVSGGMLRMYAANSSASNAFMVLVNTTGEAFKVAGNGQITSLYSWAFQVTASTRAAYLDSSGNLGTLASMRASKTDIVALPSSSWVNQLNPVSFRYRTKDDDGNFTDQAEGITYHGLIAEEVEQIIPELCYYDEKEDAPKKLVGVAYERFIPSLIKAIQELNARIATLEQRA